MIGLQILIAVLLLAGASIGAHFYSQKCIELFLGKETDDLGFIIDTECVPARWSLKYAKKVERLREKGASEARIERVKKRADRRFYRRMKRIKAFTRGAPVFADESHRKITLEDLDRIGEQWRRREFQHEPY